MTKEELSLSKIESLSYFFSDYDLKQHVKIFSGKISFFCFFLEDTRFFLSRSQLRNHGEGATRASAPFSQAI